jgi:hypothetical protein
LLAFFGKVGFRKFCFEPFIPLRDTPQKFYSFSSKIRKILGALPVKKIKVKTLI